MPQFLVESVVAETCDESAVLGRKNTTSEREKVREPGNLVPRKDYDLAESFWPIPFRSNSEVILGLSKVVERMFSSVSVVFICVSRVF